MVLFPETKSLAAGLSGGQGKQGDKGPEGEQGKEGPKGYDGEPGLAGKDAQYCPCPERLNSQVFLLATNLISTYILHILPIFHLISFFPSATCLRHFALAEKGGKIALILLGPELDRRGEGGEGGGGGGIPQPAQGQGQGLIRLPAFLVQCVWISISIFSHS